VAVGAVSMRCRPRPRPGLEHGSRNPDGRRNAPDDTGDDTTVRVERSGSTNDGQEIGSFARGLAGGSKIVDEQACRGDVHGERGSREHRLLKFQSIGAPPSAAVGVPRSSSGWWWGFVAACTSVGTGTGIPRATRDGADVVRW
jgi:hypothetical protein